MAMLNNQSRAENWLCEKPNKNMVAKKNTDKHRTKSFTVFVCILSLPIFHVIAIH